MYTKVELEFFQRQIKSFNTTLLNANRSGRLSESASSILEDLIGVNASEKGFALYSMKLLKSMSETEIDRYIEDISSAVDLLNLVSISEFDSNNISEGVFWRAFNILEDKGLYLPSEMIKDIEDSISEGTMTIEQFNAHMNNIFNEIAYSETHGVADFVEEYERIKGLK